MSRVIFLVWFAPVIFMAVSFYILLNSAVPVAAKIVFIVVPVSIWMLGGFAIYREYREHEEEHRKQEEILKEAKHILSSPKDPDLRRDKSHQSRLQSGSCGEEKRD